MLGRGFFFLDVFMDQTGHAAAGKTARRLILCFTFGVAHKPPIKRFFRPDVIVIVECELAAFAALQIFCHRFPSVDEKLGARPLLCRGKKLWRAFRKHNHEAISGQQHQTVEKLLILLHG